LGACGFEHSVAKMYLLQIGVVLAAGTSAPPSVTDAVSNLALVTLGNVLVGTVLVALVYWSVDLGYSDLQDAEKVRQHRSRIAQRLNVPERTSRLFARCGLPERPF
jgi:hypothetical protein